MPVYVYRCVSCGNTQEEKRTMAEREDPVLCNQCYSLCVYQFSLPFLITQPFHLRDGWRPKTSGRELMEQARKEEQEYEALYETAAYDEPDNDIIS